MTSVTLDLSYIQFQKLQDLANAHGISPEVLLKASFEDWIDSQSTDFADASAYVLQKNAELYQRLA